MRGCALGTEAIALRLDAPSGPRAITAPVRNRSGVQSIANQHVWDMPWTRRAKTQQF